MSKQNPILGSMQAFKQTAATSLDSYKIGHPDQYPDGTTKVYSNFTPRSDTHFNVPKEYKDKRVVWFGLQGFMLEMKAIWQTTFFDIPWDVLEPEIAEFYAPFCGPNGYNTSRMKALHELGYLPLQIKALPEGSLVTINVPVLTITNTLDAFYWLPNSMESWMSCELWKSCTSATTSFIYRKLITKYAEMTGGFAGFIQWQSHDFSLRGMSGIVDSAKSGSGHLLSGTGTDNLPAVKYINDAYFGKQTFVGGSVPATEHAVMSSSIEIEIEKIMQELEENPNLVL